MLPPMSKTQNQRPEKEPGEADFGYRRVSEDEKSSLVRDVFDSVAPRYDLMNDLMCQIGRASCRERV